jgi:hypothetical protein
MDNRILKLKSVEECENFAINANRLGAPELAEQARKRSVQIRAEAFGGKSEVELDCLRAVFAYEEVLSAEKGKRQPASRTWQMIKRKGIIPSVESVVSRTQVSTAFISLKNMGLMEFAFEAVILRHPQHFSNEAIAISTQRLSHQNVMEEVKK